MEVTSLRISFSSSVNGDLFINAFCAQLFVEHMLYVLGTAAGAGATAKHKVKTHVKFTF